MEWKITHIDETDSTNRWLREHGGTEDSVVWTDYQTAGRGCGTNRWESERGANLLFSIFFHPHEIPVNRQFQLSMAISLSIYDALSEHIGDLSIKWPNDIYWRNGKLGGILIENRIQGAMIRDSIIGVGLNVNQRQFHSDAPNPVSLFQITEREMNREQLLGAILQNFSQYIGQPLKVRYASLLYRRQGFHPYVDSNGVFMAAWHDVEDDGHLVLLDDEGKHRRYAFKEVQYVL